MSYSRNVGLAIPLLLGASLFVSGASAEPYLSVYSGFKCVTCHTNPTGGGKRNAFGTAYARTELAQRLVGEAEDAWTGEINRWFAIGGDLRAGYDYVTSRTPRKDRSSASREARFMSKRASSPDC